MFGIAGSQGALRRERYTCDLGIPEVDQPSSPLTLSSERSRLLSRGEIKIEYSSFKIFLKHLAKRLFDL